MFRWTNGKAMVWTVFVGNLLSSMAKDEKNIERELSRCVSAWKTSVQQFLSRACAQHFTQLQMAEQAIFSIALQNFLDVSFSPKL